MVLGPMPMVRTAGYSGPILPWLEQHATLALKPIQASASSRP
jgi:hypothetical protein